LATLGAPDLRADLDGGRDLPTTVAELADAGVAYVEFALRRLGCFG
jgi:hypothetical protein